MSFVTKTTEEFSTRRKVRYGAGSPSDLNKDSRSAYTLTPSTVNATLAPHKSFYGKDNENNEAYLIEFNIGDFRFDEISIRTEGRRLIVQGKSQVHGSEELSREFTRDFTLPNDVDQYSIKAQLDEATRLLTLIGRVKRDHHQQQRESQPRQSTYHQQRNNNQDDDDTELITKTSTLRVSPLTLNSTSNVRVGTTKETQNKTHVEYEIYLGNDLRDGQIKLEISNYVMTVIVNKKNWDKHGDFNLELRRQIKLPTNVNVPNIEHGIDFVASNLVIKVPFNN